MPLAKPAKERVNRSAAYKETTEDISKWTSIVKRNREVCFCLPACVGDRLCCWLRVSWHSVSTRECGRGCRNGLFRKGEGGGWFPCCLLTHHARFGELPISFEEGAMYKVPNDSSPSGPNNVHFLSAGRASLVPAQRTHGAGPLQRRPHHLLQGMLLLLLGVRLCCALARMFLRVRVQGGSKVCAPFLSTRYTHFWQVLSLVD